MPPFDKDLADDSQGPLNKPAMTPPPPPPPPGGGYPGYPPPAYFPPPQRSNLLTRILLSALALSVVANLYLGFFVFNMLRESGPLESVYAAGSEDNRIVLLPITGMVDEEMYQFVRQSLKKLRANPPKALVLQVDSGGGYVNPSDRIWNELQQFKKDTNGKIPIVASFSSIAASGAYYIACAADVIIIEPTGITRSIGVMAQAFTMERLLDKIGVTPEIVTSTGSTDKAELHPAHSWTDKERKVLTKLLDNAYEQFIMVVSEGRKDVTYGGKQYGLDEAEVRALATGAVYTADEAIANKLVDDVGYLDKAIEIAGELAKLPAGVDPQVTRLGLPKALMARFLGQSPQPGLSSIDAEKLRGWLMELSVPRMAYLADLR